MAGVGMVVHDEEGLPIFLARRFMEDCQTQLCSCVEYLELARRHTYLPIFIEAGRSQLVLYVNTTPSIHKRMLDILPKFKCIYILKSV
jgi:hypothetical protein